GTGPQLGFLQAALAVLDEDGIWFCRGAAVPHRDHTDLARLDFHGGPLIDMIGMRVDAVGTRPQRFVDYAAIHRAVGFLVLDDELAGRRRLAKLPHEHADLALLDLHQWHDLPMPVHGIAEVASFAER